MGIAIDEGYIGSLDDPLTTYLHKWRGRGRIKYQAEGRDKRLLCIVFTTTTSGGGTIKPGSGTTFRIATKSCWNGQGECSAPPLLQTKLYIPPVRPEVVPRPRLDEGLDEGLRLGCKLTLVSAPAGFGKTTLLSELQFLTP